MLGSNLIWVLNVLGLLVFLLVRALYFHVFVMRDLAQHFGWSGGTAALRAAVGLRRGGLGSPAKSSKPNPKTSKPNLKTSMPAQQTSKASPKASKPSPKTLET